MKTIEDLEEIRRKNYDNVNQRRKRATSKVVIGMGECGIKAGAREVLSAAMDEIEKLNIKDVSVELMGCIGLCRIEPIVEVIREGEEKVIYSMVNPEKVRRIIDEHIKSGIVVPEYMLSEDDRKSLDNNTIEKD